MAAKRNITDFGAKIGGARKDFHARLPSLSEVVDMTEIERSKHITKVSIWPTPDYAERVRSGTPLGIAFLLKGIRDALLPKIGERELRNARSYGMEPAQLFYAYAGAVARVRDALQEVTTYEELRAAALEAEAALDTWENSNPLRLRDVHAALANTNTWYVQSAARSAEARGWPFSSSPEEKFLHMLRFYPMRITDDGDEVKFGLDCSPRRSLTAPERAWLQDTVKSGRYETSEDAEAAVRPLAAAFLKAVREEAKSGDPAIRPMLQNIERSGLPDYRAGRKITEKDFQEEFGFRGGEFGNWLSQEDRQQTLNFAYDALCDLAQVLGLPRRAMSLDGQLSIAFGARGHGGRAAAHYEPGRKVFNFTKPSGAGCVAHEWLHALDHDLGERTGISRDHPLLPYVSEHARSPVRLKGAKSFEEKAAMGALRESFSAIRDKHQTRLATRDEAMVAVLAKLHGVGKSIGSWFGRYSVSEEEGRWFMKARSAGAAQPVAITEEYAQRWTFLLASLTEGSGAEAEFQEMGAIVSRLLRKSFGFDAKMRSANLHSNLPIKRAAWSELALVESGQHTKSVVTPLWESLKELDGKRSKPYWTQNCEVLARGFESFVQLSITASGGRSDYLVHSVEDARTYPLGAQREEMRADWQMVGESLRFLYAKDQTQIERVEVDGLTLSTGTRAWLASCTTHAAADAGSISGPMQGTMGMRVPKEAVEELRKTPWIVRQAGAFWSLTQAGKGEARSVLAPGVPVVDIPEAEMTPRQWADAAVAAGVVGSVEKVKDGLGWRVSTTAALGLNGAAVLLGNEYESDAAVLDLVVGRQEQLAGDEVWLRETVRQLVERSGRTYGHAAVLETALAEGRPVSAEAAQCYGLQVPDSYVRQGNVLAPPLREAVGVEKVTAVPEPVGPAVLVKPTQPAQPIAPAKPVKPAKPIQPAPRTRAFSDIAALAALLNEADALEALPVTRRRP